MTTESTPGAPVDDPIQEQTAEQGAAPAAKSNKKRNIIIGGVAALALAIGGAIAIPQLVHANQVKEYGLTVEETNHALSGAAQDEALTAASTQLLELQEVAARDYAAKLTALGATAAPALTAEAAKGIKDSAEKLTKALGEAPKPEADAKELELLTAYKTRVVSDKEAADKAVTAAQEQQKKDLEQAKDDAAKTKINEAADEIIDSARAQQITANQLDLTAEQAAELLELTHKVQPIKALADSQVNGQVLDQAKRERDEAVAKAEKQSKTLGAITKELDAIHAPVNATVDALLVAAKEAPAQAKEVIAAAPRSAPDKQEALTKAALEASEVEQAKPALTPTQTLNLVNTYVAAAKGVTDHHAAVLAEEAAAAAAAEAAASGASGYTDPNTGGWVETGGGWSGGGGSGGGGGGGSNNGGSSGGGGNNGGGSNNGGGGNICGGGGTPTGTPESWFAANCPYGYNWWWNSSQGGQGYCYDNPVTDDDF